MIWRAGVAALVVAALPITAGAAASAPNTVEVSSREESAEPDLDAVLVLGSRLWELREKMIAVEDKFYALYDELNKDDDFDVRCHIERPIGRIIKERVCRIAFQDDAQEVEVHALLDGHAAPPADMVAQARSVDFEKTFLRVVNSDRRLLKLVREREALEKKYDEERKKRFANRN
jgi:hypothetical protein